MNEPDSANPYLEGAPSQAAEVAADEGSRPGARGLLRNRKRLAFAAAVVVCAVAGVSIGVAASGSSSTSTSAAAPAGNGAAPGGPAAGGGGGSNARTGPEAGGSSGTVSSVSATGFTFSTPTGQKVTVTETSSTTYQNSSGSASASAVTTGESVLVFGTVNSSTITAAQVTVEPAGNPYTAVSSQVVPFQKGASGATKTVGQIPASYTEGQGTLLSGTTAYQVAQVALAAYPGGVADRVVQLSDGQYEVHFIGNNWPHQVFVNQSLQVIGAE